MQAHFWGNTANFIFFS